MGKKTLYQSELSGLGQTVVDVVSDVMASRFKQGTFYVELIVNGAQRSYHIDNPACGQAFQGRKGQRLTILATGAKESAAVQVLAADWTANAPQTQPAAPVPGMAAPASQPPPANTAAPASPPAVAPPPTVAHPAPQTPPQQPAPAPSGNGRPGTNAVLTRLANLELKCQLTAGKVAEELKIKRGIALTSEQLGGVVGRIFIQMVRENYHTLLPSDHLIDIGPAAEPEKGGQP